MKLNALQPTSSVGIHKGKKTHGMSRRRVEDIIRKDRTEIVCEPVDWIHLTQLPLVGSSAYGKCSTKSQEYLE